MAKIKEIWCMPHSHLDVGYTHPLPLLMELQSEYIDQAISLCEKTKDYPEGAKFCWTIEATYALEHWLVTADMEKLEKLKKYIKEGRICVTALPMHTTPNANANELVHLTVNLQRLRELLETEITVAINHDVNGQPWTMGQVLLDNGIDFYLTGINIHFGGIPFPRPAAFEWEQSDGRRLMSFLGEHYSLFSQFLFTEEHSVERMQEGAREYVWRLEQQGYDREFAFLTATNPPLYDNNCPDSELADLVRQYNEEGREPRLRIVTAEMLRDKLRETAAPLPVHSGDWTDYWNFGCGSTARETRVSRLAKQTLQKAEVIECFQLQKDLHYEHVRRECYHNVILFDEHTWGASQAVDTPDGPETYSQLIHKKEIAYRAADLSSYLLSWQMEKLSGNPYQSNELWGISVANTSQDEQTIELFYPEDYAKPHRQLSALRARNYLPYMENNAQMISGGLLTLKPFSSRKLSFAQLQNAAAYNKDSQINSTKLILNGNLLTTPYYEVVLEKEAGKIINITDRRLDRELLDESSSYTFFEPVRETIDEETQEPVRSTLFPRDVDLGNRSISQWNHEWEARRETAGLSAFVAEQSAHQVKLIRSMELPGVIQMKQEITFFEYSPRIHVCVTMKKEAIRKPEALYFAIPLKLSAGWECSYDTAGEFVRLDDEQMGMVCRDWLTVDTGVSLYDSRGCVTLACPDAPLVQVGDFNFGREQHRISRGENPLLLAWTMNNYWNTNFPAEQSGAMQFEYDLFSEEKFTPETAAAAGRLAMKPCVIGAVAKEPESHRTDGEAVLDSRKKAGLSDICKEGKLSAEEEYEDRWLICSEGAAIQHIYPARKQGSIILLVKNLQEKEHEFTVTFPGRSILSAELVDVQELEVSELYSSEDSVRAMLRPRALQLLRVNMK